MVALGTLPYQDLSTMPCKIELLVDYVVCLCCSPDKARAVLAPLLTAQALDLLQNCLSSKETEVWMALGPNWTMTKYVQSTDIPLTKHSATYTVTELGNH